MALTIPATFVANTLIRSASVDSNFAAILNHITAAESSASAVVITDASSNLSCETQLAVTRGGTGKSTATTAIANLAGVTATGDTIYADSASTMTRRAIGTTGQALTVTGGLPTWGTVPVAGGGTGLTTCSTGDIIKGSGAGTLTNLTIGSTNQVLIVSAGAPAWGTAAAAGGGTGQTAYATGDLLYATSATSLGKLGVGTTSQVLTVVSGLPAWANTAGPVAPITTTFTVGSGTFTATGSPLYLRVRLVGGGGGGAGGGTGGASAGSDGGYTTFGASILVAGPGLKAPGATSAIGGAGGTATVSAFATIQPVAVVTGAAGTGSNFEGTGIVPPGGPGGATALGGGGAGGGYSSGATAGITASANSGSGGGGGAGPSANFAGGGGGAGAFIEAILTSPLASYFYNIGTGGSGGTGNNSGGNGGAGAAGHLSITQYYQ